MSTKEELACVYAALILQDDEVAITVGFRIRISQTPFLFDENGFKYYFDIRHSEQLESKFFMKDIIVTEKDDFF